MFQIVIFAISTFNFQFFIYFLNFSFSLNSIIVLKTFAMTFSRQPLRAEYTEIQDSNLRTSQNTNYFTLWFGRVRALIVLQFTYGRLMYTMNKAWRKEFHRRTLFTPILKPQINIKNQSHNLLSISPINHNHLLVTIRCICFILAYSAQMEK